MGTIGSKYAPIEGENGKLDAIHSRRVEYWDNVRSLVLVIFSGTGGRCKL